MADPWQWLIHGRGVLGTSLDHLRNVVDHLHAMRIPDPDPDRLLVEADTRAAPRSG